jgi:hypothetical protein
VYHDTLGQVILLNAGLGGMDDAQRIGRPIRLWGWNGTTWTLLDSLGPPVRNLAGVAYDSRRNVIVLRGGTRVAGSELRRYVGVGALWLGQAE